MKTPVQIFRGNIMASRFPLMTAVVLSCGVLVSCGGNKSDSGKADPAGKSTEPTVETPAVPAIGFDSPDAALDALAKALKDQDEKAFRKTAGKHFRMMQDLESGISFHNDKKPADPAKATLAMNAVDLGFVKVQSKRFPAEIDGDSATIVCVFESTSYDRFEKWQFKKESGKWYLVDSASGKSQDLPAKYKWDKSIADVSKEMKDFISGFRGDSDATNAMLKKYADGVSAGLMKYAGMEQPVVIKKDVADGKDCYLLNLIGGQTRYQYRICWKDGKIVSIKQLVP